MFTDWLGDHSSRYYYWRGALWGFVSASLLWNIYIPVVKNFMKKRGWF